MEQFIYEKVKGQGLSQDEIREALMKSIEGKDLKHVLLIPPDFTRLFSNAGFITNVYYHALTERGCEVDILPALGTHVPMTEEEITTMYGDIPLDRFIEHNWRTDVVRLGEVPADYIEEITEGIWHEPVSVEVNKLVMDEKYDLILSVGQVVPHEVLGMANQAKNLFVGVGGSDMINKIHMIAAVFGMERMMGKDHVPTRKILDYAMEHYMQDRPIVFVLTVGTIPEGQIRTHGLFIGQSRKGLEAAVAMSQEINIDWMETGIKKCIVHLDPAEFKATWVGNKSVYRTRMAVADDGDLIIMGPGVVRFGEDEQVDGLIRKYGYRGRLHTLEKFESPDGEDLRNNMSASAHLIHGSSDGRFRITYAVKHLTREEIEGVGFIYADYDEMAARYNPAELKEGYNTMPDGEVIYFIPNPALGLWINKEKF